MVANPVVVPAGPAVPGTISPNSIPKEQLDELLALLQSGEARLIGPHRKQHQMTAPLYRLLGGLLANLKRGEE